MAAYEVNGTWVRDPYLVYEREAEGYLRGDSWRDGCHESRASAVHYVPVMVPGGTKTANLACSGAKSQNLWPRANGGEFYNDRRPQLEDVQWAIGPGDVDRLPDDVRMVVIGAGGNDSGFGEAVRLCLTAWAKKHIADIAFPPGEQKCRDQVRDQILPKIPEVYYNTVKTIKLLREELAAEGEQVGEYRIVLQGYPMILPSAADDWTASEEAGFSQRCPVNKDDSAFINTHFVTRLNEMLRAAAEEMNVGFIDMGEAFVGHRLCENGTVRGADAAASASRAEWVRFLDIHPNAGSVWDIIKEIANPQTGHWPLSEDELISAMRPQRHLSESFHPNFWGQQAIGYCLRRYYLETAGNPKVKCVNGAGQTGLPNMMRLDPLPVIPRVLDNPSPDLAIPQGTDANGTALRRTLTVADSVKPGHYVQLYLDIAHPRKGQLKISLVDPQGRSKLVRDFNYADTGAFASKRFTFEHYLWDPYGVKDPSGTWKLLIWDGSTDGYSGVLKSWDMKFYGP